MKSSSTVENLDEVTRKIKISIPGETVQSEIKSALVRLANGTAIKGFRPGKAPAQLVEKLHGDRVRGEVTNRLISTSLFDALKEHSIDMIGSPHIDVENPAGDSGMEFTAKISVAPAPEIEGYEKFNLRVPQREVKDSDVNAVLERYRESRGSLRKIEGRSQAEKGDVVSGELVITIAGEAPSRPEPLVTCLGESKVPAELEAGIEGMQIGESRDIESNISADHPDENLKSKSTVYRFTLKELLQKELPEVDDAFAKSAGLGVETLLELRLKVRAQLEESVKNEAKGAVQTKILEELLESNQFKVPQVLVDEEVVNLAVRKGMLDPKKVPSLHAAAEALRSVLGDVALKRVRTSVIVDRIAQKENITAGDDDIQAELNKISEQNSLPPQEVSKFFLSEERAAGFVLEITRNKVLAFLSERAKVEYFVEEDAQQTAPSGTAPKRKKVKDAEK